MVSQAQLRLRREYPTAWATLSPAERIPHLAVQLQGDNAMLENRAGVSVQDAMDDLAHHVRGESFDVGVGRDAGFRLQHGSETTARRPTTQSNLSRLVSALLFGNMSL